MAHQFDFSKITLKEFRSLREPQQTEEEADEILARVAGLEPADLEELPYDEYRQLWRAFFVASRDAGSEKNSVSESIET